MTAKADRIKRLIEDQDLKQAFQDVRDALHYKFATAPIDDSDGMTDIRKMLHLLNSVEANLKQAIEDGTLEDFRAKEDELPPELGDIKQWKQKRLKIAS